MQKALLFLVSISLAALPVRASLPTPDADDGAIKLPPGFRALVVADNLAGNATPEAKSRGALRFLAIAPNGDIFANTAAGGILALHDSTGDGRADVIRSFGTGGGTGIAFHGGWLYYSTLTTVLRSPYKGDELVLSGAPETIVKGLPAEHQHDSKNFAFDGEGRLLVEVGSPSNSFGNPDRQEGSRGGDPTEFLKTHGGFWRFDAEKKNQTQANALHFSTGHRHSLSLAWNPVSKEFFMVMMGRDQLNTVAPQYYDALDNAERVAEEMHLLKKGVNLGWPFSYYDPIKKARMVSPEFGGDNHKREEKGRFDEPLIAFPAHWAPMQMAFYQGTQYPARYRNGAFIAFHGSWNRAPMPQGGYKVCFIPFDEKGMPVGTYEIFADGFQGLGPDGFSPADHARFRPCGLAVGPDGSLYVGDSDKGRIWRIIYTGEARSTVLVNAAPVQAAATVTLPEDRSPGAVFYRTVCATCHMADGGGVTGMQPALKGSAVVAGDPARLIQVVLKGPAAVLPPERQRYQNAMPAFSPMNDADLAGVLSYIRQNFAHGASPITPEQIATQRSLAP